MIIYIYERAIYFHLFGLIFFKELESLILLFLTESLHILIIMIAFYKQITMKRTKTLSAE